MSDSEPDGKSQYAEGCNALRHYSLCVLNARTLTIAQGFVLLSGAIYFMKEQLFALSVFVSFFSMFFTLVLHGLQKNYWLHFESILNRVVELESGHDSQVSQDGPWGVYKKQREARHKKIWWRYFVVNGPFNLLLFASLAIPGFIAFNELPRRGFIAYLLFASAFFILIIYFQIEKVESRVERDAAT
jgi:hypothetical protein